MTPFVNLPIPAAGAMLPVDTSPAAERGAVARQGSHGAALATPPAPKGRAKMTIHTAVPMLIAAATVTTSVAAPDAAPVASPWWTPMFGPLVTIMSGIVAYIVSHTMLKGRQEALEQRLGRIEPKLDDIADRLSRMEGKLSA